MKLRPVILLGALYLMIGIAIYSYAANAGDYSKEWGVVLTPCRWCGTTNLIQVHHIIPQSECRRINRLDLIYDTNNMVCLCRKNGKGCHFYIGHHGKKWATVFTNVMAVIKEGLK